MAQGLRGRRLLIQTLSLLHRNPILQALETPLARTAALEHPTLFTVQTCRFKSSFLVPTASLTSSSAIQTCLVVITFLFIGIRSYVRLRILKRWDLEDYLCILTQCLFLTFVILLSLTISCGNGCHRHDLNFEDQLWLRYYVYVIQVFYSPVLAVTKITLLYIYLNLFAAKRFTWQWWVMVGGMFANGVYFTISTFLKIFACSPREKIWDSRTPGYCVADPATLVKSSAQWNTISDVLIVLRVRN